MKTSNSLKSGVTLTELIVATLVVGIIMLGVASIDLALRQTHKGASQKSIVTMQTSAMMLRISKDAQLATGDMTNFGIVVNATNLWIRKEGPANDPTTYADDVWVSYTFDPATYTLYYCTVPDSVTPCIATDEQVGRLFAFTTALEQDETNRNLYLEVTLVNQFDPASPANTFDNPQYTLTSRISPMSSSF